MKINFLSFTGFITQIEDYPTSPTGESSGCYKFITVQDESGQVVNFIAGPETYFVNQEIVSIGDRITGYYDGNRPVILIYPPQYTALIIVKEKAGQQVKVDFFNGYFLSSDGTLQLNISMDTPILLTNGQPFSQSPHQRNLIVTYSRATKSIPAQTSPDEIIVYCRFP